MPIDHNIPGVEVYGKGMGEYTLPGGYIQYVDGDPENVIVHKQVIMREMTGEEEDIMDEDALTTTERISQILAMCIEKLGTITDKKLIYRAVRAELNEGEGLPLSNQDRMAAMLFLRRVSNGDRYHLTKHQRICPYCKHVQIPKHMDLHTMIKITPAKHPTKRQVRFSLESGAIAIIRVIDAKGEATLVKLKPTTRALRSLAILPRLVSVDGKELPEDPVEGLKIVKALPVRDREKIRKVYKMIEGNVDTDLEMTCENAACAMPFVKTLDIGQVFFSPPEDKIEEDELEWV